MEAVITNIAKQLGKIEGSIDDIYYGNKLRNTGIKLPGSKSKINGVLPLVQELAKVDLCNIITYLLTNTDLTKIAGKDTAVGKKIAKLKDKAKEVASKIDSGQITALVIKDPKKLEAFNSALTGLADVIDADVISVVPQLANTKNYIDDISGTITHYSNLNTIPNADVQRILQKVNGIQSTLSSISTIGNAQDIVNLLNNVGNINIASQIQSLQKALNPAQIIPALRQVARVLRGINQITLKLLNFTKILQVLEKVQKVLAKVLRIIEKILSFIPIPNMTTVVAVTQKFSAALQTIKKFIEDVLKRLQQITSLVEQLYSFILGVSAKISELTAIVDGIIYNLETCQVTSDIEDTPVIKELKESKALLLNAKAQLDTFTTAYARAQATRTGLQRMYNGYTIRIVEEEIVDPGIKNRRRKAIAVDARGVLVVETQLTFATDLEILYEEAILLLRNRGISISESESDQGISILEPEQASTSLGEVEGGDNVIDMQEGDYAAIGLTDEQDLIALSADVTLEVSNFIQGIKKGGRKFKRQVKQKLASYAASSANEIKASAKDGTFPGIKSMTSKFTPNLAKSFVSSTGTTSSTRNILSDAARAKWQRIVKLPAIDPISLALKKKARELLEKDADARSDQKLLDTRKGVYSKPIPDAVTGGGEEEDNPPTPATPTTVVNNTVIYNVTQPVTSSGAQQPIPFNINTLSDVRVLTLSKRLDYIDAVNPNLNTRTFAGIATPTLTIQRVVAERALKDDDIARKQLNILPTIPPNNLSAATVAKYTNKILSSDRRLEVLNSLLQPRQLGSVVARDLTLLREDVEARRIFNIR